MARKLFPLPIEPILRHPLALTLPAAGSGMLFRLVAFWWESECRQLPRADHDLKAIVRAHPQTWCDHKASILQVFADIEPELHAYYTARTLKRDGLRIAARNGNSMKTAHALAERAEAYASTQTPDVSSFHQLGYVPQADARIARPQPAPDGPSKPVKTDRL